MATVGSWKREWKDPSAMAHDSPVPVATPFWSASGYIVRNRGTHPHMIYTDQEHEWLSKPAKKKRVSNQTADGSAPARKDMRKHDWAITTTIEVDGKHYVVPVQV